MKRILLSSLSLIFLLSLSVFAQDAQHLTLIVAGQPGQIPIVQMNGKSYVDIDALARLTNSSVSIKGNQVILTPPGSAPSAQPADQEPSAPAAQLKLVAERQPADAETSDPARNQASPYRANAGGCRTTRHERLRWQKPRRIRSPASSASIQHNRNFGSGRPTATRILAHPACHSGHVTKDWNLIVRWITPIVYQPIPYRTPPPNQETGVRLGDMNPSFFLSPRRAR